MSAVVPDPAATPPQTARVANIANALTLLRLLLVPVFAVALFHGDGRDTTWRVIATARSSGMGIAFIAPRIWALSARIASRCSCVTRGWPGATSCR